MRSGYVIRFLDYGDRSFVSIRRNHFCLAGEGFAVSFTKNDLLDPVVKRFFSDKDYELIPAEYCRWHGGIVKYKSEQYPGQYKYDEC